MPAWNYSRHTFPSTQWIRWDVLGAAFPLNWVALQGFCHRLLGIASAKILVMRWWRCWVLRRCPCAAPLGLHAVPLKIGFSKLLLNSFTVMSFVCFFYSAFQLAGLQSSLQSRTVAGLIVNFAVFISKIRALVWKQNLTINELSPNTTWDHMDPQEGLFGSRKGLILRYSVHLPVSAHNAFTWPASNLQPVCSHTNSCWVSLAAVLYISKK